MTAGNKLPNAKGIREMSHEQAEIDGQKRWYVTTDATPARKVLWARTAAEARERAESHGLRVIAVRPADAALTHYGKRS